MPSRVLNWDVKLVHWAVEQNGRPFEWAETDCGTLVRRAMRELYGQEIWPYLKWHSQYSAAKVLLEGGGFRGILAARGAELVDYAYVQSGDVLVAEGHGVLGLAAVVVSNRVLVADEATGVSLEPMPGEAPDWVYRLPWHVSGGGCCGGSGD